jgi:PhzF family phenazine biosynthesis protein
MIPASFTRVEVFGLAHHRSPTVGAVSLPSDASPDLRPTPEELTALGLAAMVYVVPPRRDDCAHRVRTFIAQRELPLSAKGSLAAAALLDVDDVTRFEQGVIATEVVRAADRNGAARYTLPVARPVINGRPVEDRALAASALGLDETDLAEGLPVQSVSCGWLTVLLPLASHDALARATLDAPLWQRVIEKAKPVCAVAFVPSHEGPISMRCLVANAPDDAATGLAGASVAAWLARFGVRPHDGETLITQGDAHLEIALDGALAHVTGAARVTGATTLNLR